ncbi:MAG: ATP-binding protein [Anaeromyxobacter sp.]
MLDALSRPEAPSSGIAGSIAARTRRANLVTLGRATGIAALVYAPVTFLVGDRVGAAATLFAAAMLFAVAFAAARGRERFAEILLMVGTFAGVVADVWLGGAYGTGVFFVLTPVLIGSATLHPRAVIATTVVAAVTVGFLSFLGPPRVELERLDVLTSALALLVIAAGVALVQSHGWVRTLETLNLRDEGMRTADARYRLVAEGTSDLIALLDPTTLDVLYASPSHERTLGLPPGPPARHVAREVVHPGDRAAFAGLVERAAAQGASRGIVRLRHLDGRDLTFEMALDAIEHDGRRAVALVARDVTAQRALQEQLAQAQKMEIVGRMAGGIAHDFNNLLTVARTTAEYARSGLAPDHPSRRELDDLIDATVRGAGLTRQLLQLARKEPVDPLARCKVEKVLSDLQRLLPRLLGQKITYEAHTELGLGEVVGQAVQIEQVVLNLALNARDAMPKGGRLVVRAFRIPADDRGVPSRVAIEVRDTGTGMPPEVVARLFEPFFTTKPPGVGNGLGLATSKSIVEGLGGQLRVWTEPGRGTAFTLELPEAAAPTSAPG